MLEKCEVCGYKFRTHEEMTKAAIYSCGRALIQTLPASGRQVTTCSLDRSTGEFIPPLLETQEDVDAFKEEFVKKYEDKKSKDKPK